MIAFLVLVSLEIYQFGANGFGVIAIIRFVAILVIFYSLLKLVKIYESQCQIIVQLQDGKMKIKEELVFEAKKSREYEKLFNSLEGAIYSFDLKSNDVYYSEGIVEVYGYSGTELIENPRLMETLIHLEDQSIVKEDEQRLMAGETTKVEYRIQHPKLGERWLIKISSPIIGSSGEVSKINGQIIDITFRKDLEKELKQLAYYDELTDLPNRKLLYNHIKKALARSKRHHHNFSIMFIDLDDFKIVNDTLGHDAGDNLLKEVVKRINESIREEDLIARIGGDEFIIVFEETSVEEIEGISERILKNVAATYLLDGNEANISLSIGISMYPDDGEDRETLIEHADKAMYFAKSNGKNNYKLYTPDLQDLELDKVGLLEKLKNTIKKTKFFK